MSALLPYTSFPQADGSVLYQQYVADLIDSSDRVILHELRDDGAGAFPGTFGTVGYSTKTVNVKVLDRAVYDQYEATYEDAAAFAAAAGGGATPPGAVVRGSTYSIHRASETMLAGSAITASYMVGTPTPVARHMEFAPPAITIDLAPYTTDRIVPGSVRFQWMGETYEDYEGRIYRDRGGGSNGVESGRIDYASGVATLTDYVVGPAPGTVTLQSLWTQRSDWTTASVFFMTDAAPIQPGQITITVTDVQGELINVACDLSGNLTGPHASGKFEFQNGLGELQFGDFVLDSGLTPEQKAEWWYDAADVGAVEADKIWRPWPVDPASLRYNAVSNFYLPIDPEILGLDPVRLPQDGRVPIFKKGRIVIVGDNQTVAPTTYSAGTVQLPRTRVSNVWLIGADGHLITGGWHADEDDLDAGEIHIDDVSGWAQPVAIEHRVQDMALCTDVQIDGTVSLNIPVSHDYPQGAVLSSTVLFGDKFARALPVFDQQTWNGITWADSVQGNPATATYNDAAYPVEVTNAGALTERYALRIRSDATTYDLISEHMGQIGSGTINADFEPANPFDNTKKLFTLRAAGWGSGWVAGNVLFVQTVGAMSPMACIRTVQPGPASGTSYAFDLLTGGDIDRPPSAPET